MRGPGIFALTYSQLWRKTAESNSPFTCVFSLAATQVMVNPVAGPSSKLSAANCQNRYPSPSKRSGPSRVRPLTLSGHGRSAAGQGVCDKKRFANPAAPEHDRYVTTTRRGKRACNAKYGWPQSRQHWGYQPAVIQHLNRGLWARALAPARQSCLMAIRQRAQSLGASGTSPIARPIRNAADLNTKFGPIRRPSTIGKAVGQMPGGLFAVHTCLTLGTTICSRKS